MGYFIAFSLILTVYTHLSLSCPSRCTCDGREKLVCSDVHLTPDNLQSMVIPQTIMDIRFMRNQLSDISSDILRPFRHARKLEISSNLIKEIPPHTFEEFHNLTALSLKRNQIRELHEHSLSGLSKLLHLQMSENKLSHLPEGIFDKLSSIVSIRLISNNINDIPNNVFPNLKTLRDLFIGNNKVSSLGDRAFQNMSINRLGLSQNQIRRIPMGSFQGMTILYRILLLLNPLDCNCNDAMMYSMHFKHLKNKLWAKCDSPVYLQRKDILTAYLSTDCTLCDLNPCRNGGSCAGNKTSFSCTCTDYFKGPTCQTSICQPEIRYIKQVVQLPGKTVLKYTDIDDGKKEDDSAAERKTKELETKLMILYGICSIELVIILCFVGLLILGKYQDWRLMKRYNKQNSPHVLEKFRNTSEADNASGRGFISISELVSYT